MVLRASLVAVVLRFWLPLLAACIYAWRRGGQPERVVAGILIAASFATLAVRVDFSRRYGSVQPPVLVVDLLVFGGLLAVALRANRRWPILLTALHAVTLLGHLGKLLNPTLWAFGYATMIALPVLPGLMVLVVGTWRHGRRLRRFGSDPPWSD